MQDRGGDKAPREDRPPEEVAPSASDGEGSDEEQLPTLRAEWLDAILAKAVPRTRSPEESGGTEPDPTEPLPAKLGRFSIREELGRGGFGTVYRAIDEELGREVALKVPKLAVLQEKDKSERFLAEARRLAQLRHPGILTIHDVGRDGPHLFLVMDLVRGETLQSWLQSNRPTWRQTAEIAMAVADALAYAHAQSVVHRDVKPANIALDEGLRPMLLDFGLAIGDEDLDDGSLRYKLSGTPAYMSPEQVEGKAHRVDGRTDVFSLGVVLYEMLANRRPFRASTRGVLLQQILEDDPQPIRQLEADVPAALERIVTKAMAKRQADRYTTAGDLAADLRLALEELAAASRVAPSDRPSSPAPAPPSPAPSSPSQRSAARAAIGEPGRRQVTMLSCAVVSAAGDGALASADPEDLHELQSRFTGLCERIAAQFECGVVQPGELCFGYPTSVEDPAHRAVRAGLMVVAAAPELADGLPGLRDVPLACRAAVHSGEVVASNAYGDGRSGVSVAGAVPGQVAALRGVAPMNVLVLSQETYRLVHGWFECEPEPDPACRAAMPEGTVRRVLRELPGRSRIEVAHESGVTPLIGRDVETRLLEDQWRRAVDGLGQVTLLAGDAGIGKSRLVHQLKERVLEESGEESSYVVEWRCTPYHSNSSLYPAVEYFGRRLGFKNGDAPAARLELLVSHLEQLELAADENVPMLASLLSVPLDDRFRELDLPPQKRKERMLEAIGDWMNGLAAIGPVLFIVEDLHWMDPTTLEFLTSWTEGAEGEPIFTLMTCRPEFRAPWPHRPFHTQVALRRLSTEQVAEMIRATAGGRSVPDAVVRQVLDRTDGVPLFVEEFTRMALETGALDEGGDSSDSLGGHTIPATLKDLLMARLDRLASNLDVVQQAAVIGREFGYELLEAVSSLSEEELQAELDKLVKAQMLQQRGRGARSRYVFKHALIQDAAYESMLKRKRQKFHGRVAEELEAGFPDVVANQPELLAQHLTDAGETERAIDYWLQAGRRAQRQSANTEAISHLNHGLELVRGLKDSPERDARELGLQTTLGPILMAARGWAAPEVGSTIERALALCEKIGSVSDRFFVTWGLWGWRFLRGDMSVCEDIAKDVMELVEGSDEGRALLMEAYWIPGANAYYSGRYREALELLEAGDALLDHERAAEFSRHTGQNCGVMYKAHVALTLWELGQPDLALRRAAEMLEYARAVNHPFSLAMALFFRRRIQQFCGLDDEARVSIAEEYELSHEQDFQFWETHAIIARGDLALREGRVDEARELLRLGLEKLQFTGCKLSMDHPYARVSEAFVLAGLHDEAAEWLARGFDLVENHDERGMESEMLRIRGESARARGDLAGAEADLTRALEVARRQSSRSRELRASIALHRLALQRGRSEESRTRLAEVLGTFDEGFGTADLREARALLDRST